ncbi:tautomerase family protein [Dysgonomonas sp. BGC7]|uniref:tautomerase family protein n=1 Tax=Dysgonomonas sp. BGC7 TaxID=1658008 RepID=UPI000681E217|nr:tautomerase family protein [Dysgonomonas sp. BGC7]MBD8387542.1 tautomerase family protein [Dysgonomonas sp. BGC7]
MPTIKIELIEGLEKQMLFDLRDVVTDAVVYTLQMPADDRNVRVIEYRAGFFEMKPPYEILIEIALFSGRTKETKKKLFRAIVDNVEKIGVNKDKIMIMLNEQPPQNWGVKRGIPADEAPLDFKINI